MTLTIETSKIMWWDVNPSVVKVWLNGAVIKQLKNQHDQTSYQLVQEILVELPALIEKAFVE